MRALLSFKGALTHWSKSSRHLTFFQAFTDCLLSFVHLFSSDLLGSCLLETYSMMDP